MTAENAQECFVGAVSSIIEKKKSWAFLGEKFLECVGAARVEFQQSGLIHEMRVSNGGAACRPIIIMPQGYCPDWGGESQWKAVMKATSDVLAILGSFSGPALCDYDEYVTGLLT